MDDHRLNPDMYIEGAVFIQDGCASIHDGLDDDDCLHHVLIHKILGNHRFWALAPIDNGEAGDAIYQAWSEDVEPPFSGWRPVNSMSRPPGVSFVADTVHLHEDIDPKGKLMESGDYLYLVLVLFGVLLWGAAIRLASTINVTSSGTKVKGKGVLVR
uniref:Uncharacterized protein n=1 Tax=Florenciella parvula TaxID=236787 RepID=A0A7S2G0P8_9STRA